MTGARVALGVPGPSLTVAASLAALLVLSAIFWTLGIRAFEKRADRPFVIELLQDLQQAVRAEDAEVLTLVESRRP